MMFSKIKYLFILLLLIMLVVGCARKGRPSGGPIDAQPPILLKATPDTLDTHVPIDLVEITLTFDEYIVLKDFNQNFILSPPMDPSPIFSPLGSPSKEIIIDFNGELKDNTTYTFNFGTSIRDNNEGNILPYFSYVFSTGDHIDSLSLKGKVNFPAQKEPLENLLVALYPIDSSYSDSIILQQKPYYVAKVDSSYNFNIQYLKEDNYQLVAFNDEIPNLKFDPRTERFAFNPEPVNPIEDAVLTLNLYKPEQPFRYLESEQVDEGKYAFYFQGHPDSLEIEEISHNIKSAMVIHKPYSDTLLYYFNPTSSGDTLLEKRPRLQFKVEHEGKIDTLSGIAYDYNIKTPLKIYSSAKNYNPLRRYQIETNYPIDTLRKEYIQISQDTIELDFDIERLDFNRYALNFPLAFDTKYDIRLYPNAIVDILKRTNDSTQLTLNIKEEREFGNLELNIVNAPDSSFWLKLYNREYKEVESVYSKQTNFVFRNLNPETYFIRIIVDENENGRYDTGDFISRTQPEPIYDYPYPITVKAFWDIVETWDINSFNNATTVPSLNETTDKLEEETLENNQILPIESTN